MKVKKTIYIFGNEILSFDSTPIKLAPDLQKIFPEFIFEVIDPNENLHPKNKELLIIDTIMDIDKVVIFNDIDKIQDSPRYSMHDFDLGFNLKLLQKIGELKKVTIFGVPPHIEKKEAIKQLVKLIHETIK